MHSTFNIVVGLTESNTTSRNGRQYSHVLDALVFCKSRDASYNFTSNAQLFLATFEEGCLPICGSLTCPSGLPSLLAPACSDRCEFPFPKSEIRSFSTSVSPVVLKRSNKTQGCLSCLRHSGEFII